MMRDRVHDARRDRAAGADARALPAGVGSPAKSASEGVRGKKLSSPRRPRSPLAVFSENVGPANYFSARKPRPDSGEPADSI